MRGHRKTHGRSAVLQATETFPLLKWETETTKGRRGIRRKQGSKEGSHQYPCCGHQVKIPTCGQEIVYTIKGSLIRIYRYTEIVQVHPSRMLFADITFYRCSGALFPPISVWLTNKL